MKKIIIITFILGSILCLNGCSDQKKIDDVVNLIENLPSEITFDMEEEINNIFSLYGMLSDKEQSQITNFDKLDNARIKLDEIKEINSLKNKAKLVDDEILTLPNVDNLKYIDIGKVNHARTSYNGLTYNSKEYVENLTILETLEEMVIILKEAESVNIAITNLPNIARFTDDDIDKVSEVRIMYNQLSDQAKLKINNLPKLISLENHIENINSAKVLIRLIELLPDQNDVSIIDKEVILNVKNKYMELNEESKKLVTNYSKISVLINRIEIIEQEEKALKEAQDQALNVVKEINEIPSINKLEVKDEDMIKKVRELYNSLSNIAQSYVTNYEILTQAENRIVEIIKIANTRYDVYFHLLGGTLENATFAGDVPSIKYSENIHYYSTGYWNYYETEIVLFKTSLLNPVDAYTSALKVGFNLINNQYIVDQIIPEGVAFSNENRTSDYYLLGNKAYTNGYNNLLTLSIGDELTIDNQLPETTSSNCEIKVEVIKNNVTNDLYKIAYKGINELGIPTKQGYNFSGWYQNASYTGLQIEKVSNNITLYAKWQKDNSDIDLTNLLDVVSDVATSNTIDNLVLSKDNVTLVWTSSKPELYIIKNGTGTISKVNQTHKTQIVTVSVKITDENGNVTSKSKEIIVEPVLYESFPDTPVATYFSTGAFYSYKKYNEHYLKDGSIFTEETKNTLDIIYYSFIYIDENGNCSLGDASYLEEVKKLKEYNVRIIASVSGTSTEDSLKFAKITKNDTLRKTLVTNLMNLVENNNLDGLDIDWESSAGAYVIASGLNALIKDLKSEMLTRQAANGSPYFLSIAVPASSWGLASDRFDFPTLNKYLDYINIMSYDMNRKNITTHLSPLYISSNDKGYNFGCSYGIDEITSKGFDRSKLIIGCAGYGKAYKVTGTSTNNKYPGLGVSGSLTIINGLDGSFKSGTLFGNAIKELINTGKYVEYTEYNNNGKIVGSYLYNSIDKIFVTYDSEEVVMAKYNYASSMKGVGIMCWCYSEDTSDTVINAIIKAMK